MNFIKKLLIVFLPLFFGFKSSSQNIYTLQEVLRIAKDRNPTLLTEKYEVEIAKTDLITAKQYSNFNISYETLQITNSDNFSTNTRWNNVKNRETKLEITKPIQLFGQRTHNINLAKDNVDIEKYRFLDLEKDILFDVAEKWLTVWTLQLKESSLIESKFVYDSIIRNNKYEFIPESDFLRASIYEKQNILKLNKLTKELITKQKELSRLLDVDNRVIADVEDDFIFNIPLNLEETIIEIKENRADYLELKHIENWAENNVKYQKSLAYPNTEFGFIWNNQISIPYVGFVVNIDLPFLNRNQGEIKKSIFIHEQIQQKLSFTEKNIKSEIEFFYSEYQFAKQVYEDYKELVSKFRDVFSSAEQSFFEGEISIIDYLDTTVQFYDLQDEYFDSLYEYLYNYLKFIHASGYLNEFA